MKLMNKIWKIYIAAVLIFAAVVAVSLFYPHDYDGFRQGNCTEISSDIMVRENGKGKQLRMELPLRVRIAGGHSFEFSTKLPGYIGNGEKVFIYTGKADPDIYINGRKAHCGSTGDSPAMWREIETGREDSDGLLRVVINPENSSRSVRIDRIYAGDRSAVIWHIIFAYMPLLVSAVVILIMGMIITVTDLTTKERQYVYIGIAMVLLGFVVLGMPEFRQLYIWNLAAADSVWRLLMAADIAALCPGIYEIRGRLKEKPVKTGAACSAAAVVIGILLRIFMPSDNQYTVFLCAGLLIICGSFTYQFFTYILQLKKEQRDAIFMNEEKDLFLADMSHAIRTPVNTIIGMNTMVLRETQDQKTREYADDISNAAAALVAVIDEILDFSKTSTGRMQINEAEYELISLVKDCSNMTGFRAKDKGLDFSISNNPDIPRYLYGDEARLRQIAVNLLTNAIKYTSRGHVSLDIDYRPVSEDSMILVFMVKDTGIGIKEKDIDRIFDGSEEADDDNGISEEHTGFGLRITKYIAELMGGTINVSSSFGQGSCFTVSIPQKFRGTEKTGSCMEYLQQHNVRTDRKGLSFRADGAKILAVDDVEMNLKVIRALLENTGMKIETAGGGSEALGLLATDRYDLILLDHMMPEMDGIETFRRLKKMKDCPNASTPVIMLTANAIKGAREKYLEEGFDGYIAKPVEERELIEVCRKYINPALISDVTETGENNGSGASDEISGVIDRLSGFLNIQEGMSYCVGKEDFYLEMLGDYAKSVCLCRLDKCLQDGDIENYRINAHTLKSSARTLGADDISEKAKLLEYAAKDGDITYIKENHAGFMKDNEILIKQITQALKDYKESESRRRTEGDNRGASAGTAEKGT
jgi:signal transduction histidine kinase/CheY-like chemotaxis protein